MDWAPGRNIISLEPMGGYAPRFLGPPRATSRRCHALPGLTCPRLPGPLAVTLTTGTVDDV